MSAWDRKEQRESEARAAAKRTAENLQHNVQPRDVKGEIGYGAAKELFKMNKVTKDHWETIQQWRIDEGKSFSRSRSSMIARMAGGGMKAGSEQWDANLAVLDKANRKELKAQGESATQGILDRWADTMKNVYINASYTTRERDESDRGGGAVSFKATMEGMAFAKYGPKKNPFVESGLTAKQFRNLSTEEFMEASYGRTTGYSEYTDESGDQARAAKTEDKRQQAARSQVQTASPWWG